MEIKELAVDIVLTVIMVISTLCLILRFWQDFIAATAATLMMLSLGGLFLSLGMKIDRLDKSVIARERTMRVNLEEIAQMMAQKYDRTVAHIDEVVEDLTHRMYR
ncbi:MAG: hypothetical protein ACXQTG_02520 [Methanoculleaceae archaeon]